MSEVELTKASLIELKPGCKYIIAVNVDQVGKDALVDLGKVVRDMGFEVAVMAFRGDPASGLKVIEQPNDTNNQSA